MNIYKAIKREKRFLKNFYIFMLLLSLILPLIFMFLGVNNKFYLGYLLFIEFLILAAVINKYMDYRISYIYSNNKLRYKMGILRNEQVILCDKVVLVHTEKIEEDMEILIITTANFKNKDLKAVGPAMLRKYPKAIEDYKRLKELYPENTYYYMVFRRGGLGKYMILDTLFKSCVKAVYTGECIQNIKIARGQTLV